MYYKKPEKKRCNFYLSTKTIEILKNHRSLMIPDFHQTTAGFSNQNDMIEKCLEYMITNNYLQLIDKEKENDDNYQNIKFISR